jgi:AcrR family transcriptional regulator
VVPSIRSLHLTTLIVRYNTRVARTYGGISAEERVAARRQQLLEAGLELFGTAGFAATGVKDVCRQARLTDRYFYESFKDSSGLFLAVFDTIAGELIADVLAAVSNVEREPEAQVRAALGAYLRALADDPRRGRILFIEPAAAGHQAELHARASHRQMAAAVAMVGRPHLPPTLPAHALQMGGLSMVGAIEQVMTEWYDGYVEASLEQVQEFLVQLFLAVGAGMGVLPPPHVPRGGPDSPPREAKRS